MQKNAAVLTVVCFLLCLSFNYTFPLHRENIKSNSFGNHTHTCIKEKQEHNEGFVDRTKKMAASIEQALKKIMDSSPNDKESKCSHAKQGIIDSDLSNYEQLVIMKKYPYLDLKELDFNYNPPPNKNARQSLSSVPILGQDPSFCDSSDEGPIVEITNRGLSGFAIPSKLVKSATAGDTKAQLTNAQNDNHDKLKLKTSSPVKRHSEDLNPLKSLEEDIKDFETFIGR